MMDIDMEVFEKKFAEEYKRLYDNDDADPAFGLAVEAFDHCHGMNEFTKFLLRFVAHRMDFVSSDREAAAFMFALFGGH